MYYEPNGRRYTAPTTFVAKADARGWLSVRQAEIITKKWTPPNTEPTVTRTTFSQYAKRGWLSATSSNGPVSTTNVCRNNS